MSTLTPKQQRIYDYILTFTAEHGYPPSVREIGDLVVVHRQSEAHSGEIVVALFEDEATVKTLRRKDGHTWLMPANPAYEPIPGDRAEIVGKVVAVVRRY